jgi:hypothetical protein
MWISLLRTSWQSQEISVKEEFSQLSIYREGIEFCWFRYYVSNDRIMRLVRKKGSASYLSIYLSWAVKEERDRSVESLTDNPYIKSKQSEGDKGLKCPYYYYFSPALSIISASTIPYPFGCVWAPFYIITRMSHEGIRAVNVVRRISR